ncbi:hypothetical protein TRVL_07414 [Trypanosoma vivax]|nr:hypothetical protein TRVL_07414 [Trypanosoma vivax]
MRLPARTSYIRRTRKSAAIGERFAVHRFQCIRSLWQRMCSLLLQKRDLEECKWHFYVPFRSCHCLPTRVAKEGSRFMDSEAINRLAALRCNAKPVCALQTPACTSRTRR